MTLRRFAILFLWAQAVGASLWWILLWTWPDSRLPFKARESPDVTLMAFFVADAILFIGTSAASGIGFLLHRRWAWPLLCLHAGAAGYAGLYCWTLTLMTGGDGMLGALLMSPSLVIPGYILWRLREAHP